MKLRLITEAVWDKKKRERLKWRDRFKLLLQYKNDPSVFVTFTYVNKLGNERASRSSGLPGYGHLNQQRQDAIRGMARRRLGLL